MTVTPSSPLDHCATEPIHLVERDLFDNAIKYRKPDADLRVTLGFVEPSGRVYVRDDGSGFDPAMEGEPFQPFLRLRNASGVVGAGIGLTVVSRIVEKLHGQVNIEPASGEGTTVWLTMDLAEQSHNA